MTRVLFVVILILVYSLVFSQNQLKGIVGGYVFDVSSGEALIGANIYIKELKLGNSSNTSGYFVITDVPVGDHVLICSLVGYKTKTQKIHISVEKDPIIKINLESEILKSKEVVVTAEPTKIIERLFEQPVSRIELTPTQINRIPQVVESDLLRSLQTLPGVVSVSDFSSALFIRGGKPDQNLYLLDGADVYNPEHAFGLFSTFNTDAIKRVDLSKGGFTAEYGGRLSSILNVNNLDGNRNRIEGNFGFSLLSAKMTIQSPVGEFGSISGSFRRTYFDQTIAKWIKDQNIPDYYFYDGNLKAFIDVDDNNKLTVSYFGGRDNLNFVFDKKKSDSPGFKYAWGNVTGSVNWKTILSSRMFANFWVTASSFTSNFDFKYIKQNEENNISDLSLKASIEYYITEKANLKFGFEQKNLHTLLKEDYPGGLVDIDKKRTHNSTFVSFNWKPSVLWDIEAGARYDYFRSDKNFQNIDPRFSIKYRLTEDMNVKFATGIYHQYLNRVERGFISGIWSTADQYSEGARSIHYIFGFQKEFAKVFQIEIEAFYKNYKNLSSLNPNFFTDISGDSYNELGQPVYTELRGLFNRGDGFSKGIEVLLKKDAGSITGWIGYSYTNTELTIDGINNNKSFVPRHNRNSVLNFVANMDLKDFIDEISGTPLENYDSRWLIGMNFVYSSGQPITVPSSVYFTNSLPNGMTDGPFIYPTDINNYTLPAYMRMDLSITYEKRYKGWTISPYLQIYNLGNRKNVFFINYKNEVLNNTIKQEVEVFNMLPILPSIGVNIKF